MVRPWLALVVLPGGGGVDKDGGQGGHTAILPSGSSCVLFCAINASIPNQGETTASVRAVMVSCAAFAVHTLRAQFPERAGLVDFKHVVSDLVSAEFWIISF